MRSSDAENARLRARIAELEVMVRGLFDHIADLEGKEVTVGGENDKGASNEQEGGCPRDSGAHVGSMDLRIREGIASLKGAIAGVEARDEKIRLLEAKLGDKAEWDKHMVATTDRICGYLRIQYLASRSQLQTRNSNEEQDAFGIASCVGDLPTVKALLALGVDVNHSYIGGRTVLHYAAEYGHFLVLEALLSADADKRVRDIDGRTPLQLALRSAALPEMAKTKLTELLQ